MINITTSETFFNKDLNDILKQNNTEFNEYILNSGTLLFKMKDSNNENFDILNTIGYYQNVMLKTMLFIYIILVLCFLIIINYLQFIFFQMNTIFKFFPFIICFIVKLYISHI